MAFPFTIIKKYYLVRHAEKQDPTNADTPISVAGQKRAVALKKVLETKHIQNIIVSQFIRTQQTAKPLADAYIACRYSQHQYYRSHKQAGAFFKLIIGGAHR
jgi:broad specificity phosphatase PhoE